jgi:serine/threonine-protein kinase HipA
MNRTIAVFLGETPRQVGSLRFDSQGARQSAAFEYHPTWLASAGAFAIAPTLPLVTGMQFHKRIGEGSVFHGAIADTEPDGWGRNVIRRDHAKRRQSARRAGEPTDVEPLSSLDFLLAVDDANRVGALRFQNGVFQRAAEEGRRTAPPLIELWAACRRDERRNGCGPRLLARTRNVTWWTAT